jgi:SAM-dependent methyltransferase
MSAAATSGGPVVRLLDMSDPPLRLRLARLRQLIQAHVPPDARILEVGCGRGELALALDRDGWSVTAIDPDAPAGGIFRRTSLEDFVTEGLFGAVVASVSLHHVEDPDRALDKIVDLLESGGLLVVDEFAKERLEGATARWYFEQRRASSADVPDDFAAWARRNSDDLADVHPFKDVRRELDARFAERFFERTPYLYDYHLDDAVEPLERALIDQRRLEPTGVRYIGERR